MVQLQKCKQDLKAAKLQVAAVSYDSVDTLARFAEKAGIEFPLLSDAESKTIDAWSVRNREIQGSKIDGVPHPGTIVVGTDGKVIAKLFHEGYKKRHVGQEIIEAAKVSAKNERKQSEQETN